MPASRRSGPQPPTVLLVSSGGGHLQELVALAPRLVPPAWRVAWMVPAGPQARGLLPAGAEVHPLRDTGPRDLANSARNLPAAARLLRRLRPAAVLSTGAAVAVPILVAARAARIESHYVESAARTAGPSLTGRILARVPGVHTYTQWPQWASPDWPATGSVFDGFVADPRPPAPVRSIVVTLGLQRGYGFRRLAETLVGLIPAGVEVLWQTGGTDVSGLGIAGARESVAPDELRAAMRRADVVIAHAGIGSALNALAEGQRPLLVPREAAFGEHVDDHQTLIGAAVADRQLALTCRAGDLTWADVVAAGAATVRVRPMGPLSLAGHLGQVLARQPPDPQPMAH